MPHGEELEILWNYPLPRPNMTMHTTKRLPAGVEETVVVVILLNPVVHLVPARLEHLARADQGTHLRGPRLALLNTLHETGGHSRVCNLCFF